MYSKIQRIVAEATFALWIRFLAFLLTNEYYEYDTLLVTEGQKNIKKNDYKV